MVGSHDAGVTFGKGNTQTQNLDIYEQAEAGVVQWYNISFPNGVAELGAGIIA